MRNTHQPNHLLPNPVEIPVSSRTPSSIVLDYLNAPRSPKGAPTNPQHTFPNPLKSRTPSTTQHPSQPKGGTHQPRPIPTQPGLYPGTVPDPLKIVLDYPNPLPAQWRHPQIYPTHFPTRCKSRYRSGSSSTIVMDYPKPLPSQGGHSSTHPTHYPTQSMTSIRVGNRDGTGIYTEYGSGWVGWWVYPLGWKEVGIVQDDC